LIIELKLIRLQASPLKMSKELSRSYPPVLCIHLYRTRKPLKMTQIMIKIERQDYSL